MTNANAANDKVIGDGGPEGSTFGKDINAPVGFHGSKVAQVEGTGTELMGVVEAFFTAMGLKGLYNQSGSLGDDLRVGTGTEVLGIIRSDSSMVFITDGLEDSEDANFIWNTAGTTFAGSTEQMRLDSDSFLTVKGGVQSTSPSKPVGYAVGAGGAVTQTTTRATGVTLSFVTGKITTDTTSLAAGAAATFTVTNTKMGINYIPQVSIRSGATTDQTKVYVTAIANGSFNITVENNHASTAEVGAIVINFAIFAATST